jgi:hypothetical protein
LTCQNGTDRQCLPNAKESNSLYKVHKVIFSAAGTETLL